MKFSKRTNNFENTISKDKSNIARDDRMILKADKTTNCYRVSKDLRDNLLDVNIRKDYKKANDKVVQKVHFDAKKM